MSMNNHTEVQRIANSANLPNPEPDRGAISLNDLEVKACDIMAPTLRRHQIQGQPLSCYYGVVLPQPP
jgi:hypothetical protein